MEGDPDTCDRVRVSSKDWPPPLPEARVTEYGS